MVYNDFLAERIRSVLARKQTPFEEKKMMGGLCFMVDDKMCLGIVRDDLMARVDPAIYEDALQRTGARPMDFTGRPMMGYLFISPEGVDRDEDLDAWVQLCLDFNPKAKSSKKRKKKA